MRFSVKAAGLALITMSLTLGCGNVAKSPNLRVAVSIFPLYDLVRQVAGPEVDVLCLMPPGANPHTFTPRPSDMARLEGVDLFIAVSPNFDGWAADHLPPSTKRLFLADVDDHSDELAHEHGHDHAHGHGGDNPHIWLSLHRAAALTGRIAKGLTAAGAQIDPAQKQRFLTQVDSLHQNFKALFSAVDNKLFFQWHPAWDYFAADYGLHIAGTLEQGHGDTPSVRAMQTLINTAKTHRIQTVVVGLNIENQAAEALAHEINGAVLRLDTMGNPDIPQRSTYLKLMADNAEKLASALKAQ